MYPDDTTPLKMCIDCGRELPRTAEYFHRNAGNKDGLRGHCKECGHLRYRARTSAKERRFRMRGGHKICGQCERELPATTEYYYPNKYGSGGLSSECRECKQKLGREYYVANREAVLEKVNQYQIEHRDEIRARAAKRYADNPDPARERVRQWKEQYPERHRANLQRRKARKRNLPDTFSAPDYQVALAHFRDCCAVCGRQLNGLFHEVHWDHWIPLIAPACPGTVPHNMVPLCSDCNLKKNARDPAEWLVERFGRRKGMAILRRVEAFLNSRKPLEGSK